MKTKENRIYRYLMFFLAIVVLILLAFFYSVFVKNNAYATETLEENKDVKISNANECNIYKIIQWNTNTSTLQHEEIETKDEVLEFITKYRTNTDLPQGTIQVIQEGREGLQQIATKKIYQGDRVISEELINAKVTKASVDKIVEIGGAEFSSKYEVKEGDNAYVTADRTAIMLEPNADSKKVTIATRNTEFKILEIDNDWYKVANSNTTGWIKKESTTYINPNSTYVETFGTDKSREELLATLSFDMKLNEPSGLSLEQFKKVLTDSKDVNKIFENNAEYFYYIEEQYNINGLFIASIGIHESAWGTSKIARDKTNLFGYGAYDSNPYNGAYTFSSFSESIDLMARVLTKYYLNPSGTQIFNSELAKGTYYNGPTFSGVNTRYATDKNWANAVYKHMKYLYEKL